MGVLTFISVFCCTVAAANAIRNPGLTWGNYDFINKELNNFDENLNLKSSPAKNPPSLSCVLFGDSGCQGVCEIECKLYGCQSNANCRKGMYCECNEVYSHSGTRDISADQFSTMPFDELWYYKFVRDNWSTEALNKIKNDRNMKEAVEAMLRNPHQTGDEIKKVLLQQYPEQTELKNLSVINRGEKSNLVDANGDLEYNNLGQYFQDLHRRIAERARKLRYRARLIRALRNVGSREELEYIKKQVDATGNEKLKLLVDRYLRRRRIYFDDENTNDFYQFGKPYGRGGNMRNRYRNGNYRTYGRRPPTMKHVTLKNGGRPVTLDADEDKIVELSLMNDMINAADEEEIPVQPGNQKFSSTGFRNQRPGNLNSQNQFSGSTDFYYDDEDDFENHGYRMKRRPDFNDYNRFKAGSRRNPKQGQFFEDDNIRFNQDFPQSQGFRNRNRGQFSKNQEFPQEDFSSGFRNPNRDKFSGNFGNNFGDSIKKNIEEKMKKQQEEAEKEMKDDTPNNPNVHKTYTFNSASNNVASTDINGKKTSVQSANMKNMHKDSDHPEDNLHKEFDLNAISLKDPQNNEDKKFVETVNSDKLKGTTQVKDRIKNNDNEVVFVHDEEDHDNVQKKASDSSKYYLVIDDDGKVVHTSSATHEAESEADKKYMDDLMKKYPGYVIGT